MTTSQRLSIACSTAIMAAWATQGMADDKAADASTSRSQADTSTVAPVNPTPSTYRTEGTAADRTVPGATRTRSTEAGTANPMPATTRTEGTAADRTPPGETPVRGAAAPQASEQITSKVAKNDVPGGMTSADPARGAHTMRGTNLIGLVVRDSQGANVGSVEDVVIDAAHGQLAYALIGFASSRGNPSTLVAVPWNAFARMIETDAVVVDRSKIASAPQVSQAELQQIDGRSWRQVTDRYWGRSKTASAEPAQ